MLGRIIQKSKNLLSKQAPRRLFCQLPQPTNSDNADPVPEQPISLESPAEESPSISENQASDPELNLLEPKNKIPIEDQYASMYQTENQAVKALYEAFDAFKETSDKREGLREITRVPKLKGTRRWQDFFLSFESVDIEMDWWMSWEVMNRNNHGQVLIAFMTDNLWTGIRNFIKCAFVDMRVSGKFSFKRSWPETGISTAAKYYKPIDELLPYLYFYVKQESFISIQRPMLEIKNKKYILSVFRSLHE